MKYQEFSESKQFDKFKQEYDKLVRGMSVGRDYREINKDIIKLRAKYNIED